MLLKAGKGKAIVHFGKLFHFTAIELVKRAQEDVERRPFRENLFQHFDKSNGTASAHKSLVPILCLPNDWIVIAAEIQFEVLGYARTRQVR